MVFKHSFFCHLLQLLILTGFFGKSHSSGSLHENRHASLFINTSNTTIPAHPGWESSAWCPLMTLRPLLALLPCCPDTVDLLSQDQAWGQTFWQVKGQGMRWWCHHGCWRVARRVGGGLSRGFQSHTRVTVLCSQPVGTQWGTELPLMALNSAWWLALF